MTAAGLAHGRAVLVGQVMTGVLGGIGLATRVRAGSRVRGRAALVRERVMPQAAIHLTCAQMGGAQARPGPAPSAQLRPGSVARVVARRGPEPRGPEPRVIVRRVPVAHARGVPRVAVLGVPAGRGPEAGALQVRRRARRRILGRPGPADRAAPKAPGTVGLALTGPERRVARMSRAPGSAAVLVPTGRAGPSRRMRRGEAQARARRRDTARLMRAAGARPRRVAVPGARATGAEVQPDLAVRAGPAVRASEATREQAHREQAHRQGEAGKVPAGLVRGSAEDQGRARSQEDLRALLVPGAQVKIPPGLARPGTVTPGAPGWMSLRLSPRTSWTRRRAMSSGHCRGTSPTRWHVCWSQRALRMILSGHISTRRPRGALPPGSESFARRAGLLLTGPESGRRRSPSSGPLAG